jgi:glycosyltransferase involved in cell wall biosynthesis
MFVVKKGRCVRLPRSVERSQGAELAEQLAPKITVVSLSFNQAQYLEQSILSVLDQNYPNLEYILIDGNSTDGSINIINKYRSRINAVVIEPDEGQSDALNKGFALATGDIMNWLCSDDLLEPGSLHAIGRAYRKRAADIIVGGCVRIGNSRSDVLFEHHNCLSLGQTVQLDPLDLLKFMGSWQKGKYFFQPETFFSRRAWLVAGGYIKKHLYYAMDYDLWLRMALAGATAHHIPRRIACSRVHEAQKTKQDKAYLHQVYQIMEEYSDMFGAIFNSTQKPL